MYEEIINTTDEDIRGFADMIGKIPKTKLYICCRWRTEDKRK